MYALPSATPRCSSSPAQLRVHLVARRPAADVLGRRRPSTRCSAVSYPIGSLVRIDRGVRPTATSPSPTTRPGRHRSRRRVPHPNELRSSDLTAACRRQPGLETILSFARPDGITLSRRCAAAASPIPARHVRIHPVSTLTFLDASHPDRHDVLRSASTSAANRRRPAQVRFAPSSRAPTSQLKDPAALDVLQVALEPQPALPPPNPVDNDFRRGLSARRRLRAERRRGLHDAGGRRVVRAAPTRTHEVVVIDGRHRPFPLEIPRPRSVNRVLVFPVGRRSPHLRPCSHTDSAAGHRRGHGRGQAPFRRYPPLSLDLDPRSARSARPGHAPLVFFRDRPRQAGPRPCVPVPALPHRADRPERRRTCRRARRLATAPLAAASRRQLDTTRSRDRRLPDRANPRRSRASGFVALEHLHPTTSASTTRRPRPVDRQRPRSSRSRCPLCHATIIPSPTSRARRATVLTHTAAFLNRRLLAEEH